MQKSADFKEREIHITREIEDVRLALAIMRESGGVQLASELIAAIGPSWRACASLIEQVTAIERLISLTSTDDSPVLAKLWRTLASAHNNLAEHQLCVDAASEAVVFARNCADQYSLAEGLLVRALGFANREEFEEAKLLETSRAFMLKADTQLHLGVIELSRGNFDAALRLASEAIPALSNVPDPLNQIQALTLLAEAEHNPGQHAAAIQTMARAYNLRLHCLVGPPLLVELLHRSAVMAIAFSRWRLAALLLAYIEPCSPIDPNTSELTARRERVRTALVEAFDPQERTALETHGAAMTLDEAIELALSLDVPGSSHKS